MNIINVMNLGNKKKKVLIAVLSVALAARMTGSVSAVAQAPPISDPPAIEYQMESEETMPVEEPASAPAGSESQDLTFWGLQRRLWTRMTPVEASIWGRLWRPLAWLWALILTTLFILVWPLPQLLGKAKHQFSHFASKPQFTRLSTLAKIFAGAALVAAFFLIPSARRPWLLVIGAIWLILMFLAFIFLPRKSGQNRKIPAESV